MPIATMAPCTLCTFGMGATDQGQVYEAFNLAARWRLPIIFMIDNDTGVTDGSKPQLAARGSAFDIPGGRSTRIDIRAVHAAGSWRHRPAHGQARDRQSWKC